MMRKLATLVLVMNWLLLPLESTEAQNSSHSFPASELSFKWVFASRPGDSITYLCVGSGFIRAMTAGDFDLFIKQWLAGHPQALATPISEQNWARVGTPPQRMVYLWIEDGGDSLNAALIREGMYPGGVMLDMVEAQQRLLEMLRKSESWGTRKQVEKEIEATPPEDRPRRLVSDAGYTERIKRIQVAETQARENKKGIWSDGRKEERESEGIE